MCCLLLSSSSTLLSCGGCCRLFTSGRGSSIDPPRSPAIFLVYNHRPTPYVERKASNVTDPQGEEPPIVEYVGDVARFHSNAISHSPPFVLQLSWARFCSFSSPPSLLATLCSESASFFGGLQDISVHRRKKYCHAPTLPSPAMCPWQTATRVTLLTSGLNFFTMFRIFQCA